MGEHRKPKPWAVIALALAGGALAFDQLILSASADESATTSDEIELSATNPDGSAETQTMRSGPTLADRFQSYAKASDASCDLEKAFDVPSDLREPLTSTPDAVAAPVQELGLRLSSILTRNGERLAIVNGRPLRVGDSVGGAVVSEIAEDSVTLDTAIGLVTLDLKRPTLSE